MFNLYAFHAGLTAQVLNISCKYKSLFIDVQSFIGFCFKIPFSCFLHIWTRFTDDTDTTDFGVVSSEPLKNMSLMFFYITAQSRRSC